MRFGFHLSVTGGLLQALEEARARECEALQIFASSPRVWRRLPLDEGEARAFRRRREEMGFTPLVVHTPYLLNLASVDEELHRKSAEALLDDLRRAEALGAEYVVTHLGSGGTGDRGEARERVGRMVAEVLSGAPFGPTLLLENSAGGGGTVGSSLDELARLLDRVPAAGLCFDVCHFHASGEDLAPPGAVSIVVERMSEMIGLDRLRLIHANDCKYPSGTHADRHQHIGQGTIGVETFRELVNHPALAHLPCILETPTQKLELDLKNIRLIRSLVGA